MVSTTSFSHIKHENVRQAITSQKIWGIHSAYVMTAPGSVKQCVYNRHHLSMLQLTHENERAQ